jgi:hypothetical protein
MIGLSGSSYIKTTLKTLQTDLDAHRDVAEAIAALIFEGRTYPPNGAEGDADSSDRQCETNA